jgi:hypothetical protein
MVKLDPKHKKIIIKILGLLYKKGKFGIRIEIFWEKNVKNIETFQYQ